MSRLNALRGSEVISTQKSRMGGEISRLRTASGTEIFVKSGRGFERLELLREHRNVLALSEVLPVPAVVDFQDNGSEARLAVERLPGAPLHEVYQRLGRQNTLVLVAEILETLWRVSATFRPNVFGSVEEEMEDIRSLLDQKLIDRESFEAASGGKAPETMYQEITAELMTHDKDVISQGDFCLPNILVDEGGRWGLIDLGKAALGDRFRDLSSIDGSLRRNIGPEAFSELLAMLQIVPSETARRKMTTYTNVDLFWYNARL
jgi:aminoglycoside 3'-phosphotransferase-2